MDTTSTKLLMTRKLRLLLEEFDLNISVEDFIEYSRALYIQNEPPVKLKENEYKANLKPFIRLMGVFYSKEEKKFKKKQFLALKQTDYIVYFVEDKAQHYVHRLSMIIQIVQQIQLINELEKKQAILEEYTSGEMAYEKFFNFGEGYNPDPNYSFLQSDQKLNWKVGKVSKDDLYEKLYDKVRDPAIEKMVPLEFKLMDTKEN